VIYNRPLCEPSLAAVKLGSPYLLAPGLKDELRARRVTGYESVLFDRLSQHHINLRSTTYFRPAVVDAQ
jgi:hypothetical protein